MAELADYFSDWDDFLKANPKAATKEGRHYIFCKSCANLLGWRSETQIAKAQEKERLRAVKQAEKVAVKEEKERLAQEKIEQATKDHKAYIQENAPNFEVLDHYPKLFERIEAEWRNPELATFLALKNHGRATADEDSKLFPDICVIPQGISYKCDCNDENNIAVIDIDLPDRDSVPNILGFRSAGNHLPLKMNKSETRKFYDETVSCQILLGTKIAIEQNLSSKTVVANGIVNYVDGATGQDKRTCILSVEIPREKFERINFDRIDPYECVKSFKPIMAGVLQNLTPVKPILTFDKNDHRFIESSEIVDNLSENQNLATMLWEDFEHLVRELFERYFEGDGTEVRVTQASRDGGVDAIAFDPDPIRGGKFVIQAKRYNNVVPVSAVRDLYGTMINEGATKGILVTTAYYGPETYDFAKDKPISLIAGSNLVYMLEQYGYHFRVDLKEE
ncbi:MAG: restriction endonuclease [Coriobacteriales bacterium]|nr:restriction endonuclease [Coriobacteriales bacterium]